MAAHWIGLKKLQKFSRKTGINFIAGENKSGTTYYKLLSNEKILYFYNRKNNSIKFLCSYTVLKYTNTVQLNSDYISLLNRAKFLKTL